MCSAAEPVMIVMEFMSHGSLEHYLKVNTHSAHITHSTHSTHSTPCVQMIIYIQFMSVHHTYVRTCIGHNVPTSCSMHLNTYACTQYTQYTYMRIVCTVHTVHMYSTHIRVPMYVDIEYTQHMQSELSTVEVHTVHRIQYIQ